MENNSELPAKEINPKLLPISRLISEGLKLGGFFCIHKEDWAENFRSVKKPLTKEVFTRIVREEDIDELHIIVKIPR